MKTTIRELFKTEYLLIAICVFNTKKTRALELIQWCSSRGAGGGHPPLNLADQLTLFKPGGADYTPHTTTSPSGFKKLSTPLFNENKA